MKLDGVPADLPMLFVDNVAASNESTLKSIYEYYNGLPSPDTDNEVFNSKIHMRTLAFFRTKMRYCAEIKSGSASIETDSWTLAIEGRENEAPILAIPGTTGGGTDTYHLKNTKFAYNSVLEGADQPPLYPYVDTYRIHLRQVERLSGKKEPAVRARFDGHFVANGLPLPVNPKHEFVGSLTTSDKDNVWTLKQKLETQNQSVNAQEIFLNFIDQKEFSMGEKADQSGGIFSPEGVIVGLSRSKGIVTFAQDVGVTIGTTNAGVDNKVTSITNLYDSQLPVDPSVKLKPAEIKKTESDLQKKYKKIYENIFSKDAKLLGVVKIRKIFEIIQRDVEDPKNGAPELVEKIQYGAQQASGSIEEANRFIREDVIKPVSAAIKQISRDWDKLDEAIKEKQRLDVDIVEPVSLKEIFPELHLGLANFDKAIDAALAQTDPISFAFELSEVHEAGRRFIDSLIATAMDPTAGLAEVFQGRLDQVTEFGKELLGGVQNALKKLEKFVEEQIIDNILGWIVPGQTATEVWPYLPLPYPVLQNSNLLQQLMPTNADMRTFFGSLLDDLIAGRDPNIHTGLEELRTELISKAKAVLDLPPSDPDKIQLSLYLIFLGDGGATPKIFFENILSDEVRMVENIYKQAILLKGALSEKSATKAIEKLLAMIKIIVGPIDINLGDLCDAGPGGFELDEFLQQISSSINFEGLAFSKAGFKASTTPCPIPIDGSAIDGRYFATTDRQDKVSLALWETHIKAAGFYTKVLEAKGKIDDQPFDPPIPVDIADTIKDGFADAVVLARSLSDSSGSLYASAYNDSRALSITEQELKAAIEDLRNNPHCTNIDEKLKILARIPKILGQYGNIRKELLKELYFKIGHTVTQIQEFTKSNQPMIVAIAAGSLLDQDHIKRLKLVHEPTYDNIKQVLSEVENDVNLLVAGLVKYLHQLVSILLAVTENMNDALGNLQSEYYFIGLTFKIEGLDKLKGDVTGNLTALSALKALLGSSTSGLDTLKSLHKKKVNLLPPDGSEVALLSVFKKIGDGHYPLKLGIEGLGEIESKINDVIRDITDNGKQILVDARKQTLYVLDDFVSKLIRPSPNDNALLAAYEAASDKRRGFINDVNESSFAGSFLANKFIEALTVDKRDRDYGLPLAPPPPPPHPTLPDNRDRLSRDVLHLKRLIEDVVPRNKPAPISDRNKREYLLQFLKEWGNSSGISSTPVIIINNLRDIAVQLLRGEIIHLLPLREIRQQIEDYILQLVPVKIEMNYNFSTKLDKSVKEATLGIFEPDDGCIFAVDTKVQIDMQSGNPEFKMNSIGSLGQFKINLVGSFKAVEIFFNSATFTSGTNRKSNFDLDYDRYELGAELAFLADLAKILSPKGNGFYIKPTFSPFGVEAGYSLNLGTITFGTASFFNVSFRAALILPFNGSEARFVTALSQRDKPFTVSFAPYGGSGFFSIESTGDGIVSFEASLEFGFAGAFKFGPLTGQGRVMAGFYIRVHTIKVTLADGKTEDVKVTEIMGTFYAGGSASIWIFSISASLSVRLGQVAGQMIGEAVFTFAFSMGFLDFDYTVAFKREEPNNLAGPSSSLMESDPGGLILENDEFCHKEPSADIVSEVHHPYVNWKKYNKYFDQDLNLGGLF